MVQNRHPHKDRTELAGSTRVPVKAAQGWEELLRGSERLIAGNVQGPRVPLHASFLAFHGGADVHLTCDKPHTLTV